MASAPSKLAAAAISLLALWIIAYWLTPAPANEALKISIGQPPASWNDPVSASPAREIAAPGPEPEPTETEAEPPSPRTTTTPTLVEVKPDDLGAADSPAPTVIPPTFRRYTTQSGDTFQRIASRFYGSSGLWRVIAKANPTVDPNRLGPGIELYIPVDTDNIQGKLADGSERPPTPQAPESAYTEYVVQRGDTLSDISKALYGRATLWQRIVDANPDVDPDRLRPGTTLRIPPPPAPN